VGTQSIPPLDIGIVLVYLLSVIVIGYAIRKRATRQAESFFLADRQIPWWMLGLSGCSSYIDIGGTMAIVGLVASVGARSVWIGHIAWGFFMMSFFMAYQAKWIRRSGVMTFAEWNRTRFGDDRGAEAARVATALFLLLLMTCNLTLLAVGTGKFAESYLPIPRWTATLGIFTLVGLYVTMGGFLGVILTDIIQTALIAIGAVVLIVLAWKSDGAGLLLSGKPEGWLDLWPSWRLWPGYAESTSSAFAQYDALGPFLLVGLLWCVFRLLSGPNVWDFQFFLSARSPRDASLAGGLWTLGFTLRWMIVFACIVLGAQHLVGEAAAQFDAERTMPAVLMALPMGLRGIFLAVLLAALMSSLDAATNVTSSIVVNDLLKRYFARTMSERSLVRAGQAAGVAILVTAFIASLFFEHIVTVWELIIFVVLTLILVPATFRWHWWRFGAMAFVWGMIGSGAVIIAVLVAQAWVFPEMTGTMRLGLCVVGSLIVTTAAGFLNPPADTETLVDFYHRVRPWGLWGPIRKEAVRRGLVAADDREPLFDVINALLAPVFQICLFLAPFYAALKLWRPAAAWTGVLAITAVLLYFTWYRTLPPYEADAATDPTAQSDPPA